MYFIHFCIIEDEDEMKQWQQKFINCHDRQIKPRNYVAIREMQLLAMNDPFVYLLDVISIRDKKLDVIFDKTNILFSICKQIPLHFALINHIILLAYHWKRYMYTYISEFQVHVWLNIKCMKKGMQCLFKISWILLQTFWHLLFTRVIV